MKYIPTGTIVCVIAPGSRGSDGKETLIPAVVTGQHPDGSLALYSFHFEGVPINMTKPLSQVFMVGQTEPVEKAPERVASFSL